MTHVTNLAEAKEAGLHCFLVATAAQAEELGAALVKCNRVVVAIFEEMIRGAHLPIFVVAVKPRATEIGPYGFARKKK